MLIPELDRYDLDKIAQTLTQYQYVVASGDLDSRIAEIKAGRPYKGDALAKAMRSEYEELFNAETDKQLTAQRFGKSSGTMAVSAMSGHRIHGQPIDLLELKTTMEDQMKALADSGAERRDMLAMLALQAQQMGEALMVESASAPTPEAKALVLKNAASNCATSAKIVEQLHNLNRPAGTIVDGHSIEEKQLPTKTKKLKGKK
jgi:hypothetical protein